MKLTKKSLISLVTVATTMSIATPVFAANGEGAGDTATTKGKATFIPASETANPLDPSVTDPTPVTPDPENPGGSTTGQLRIDFVPDLVFSNIVVKGETTVKGAEFTKLTNTTLGEGKYVPNFIQVNDTRGDKFGWKIQANVGDLMKYEKNSGGDLEVVAGSKIEGATITLDGGKVISKSDMDASDTKVAPTLNSATQAVVLSADATSSPVTVFNAATDTASGIRQGYNIWTGIFGEESDAVATTDPSLVVDGKVKAPENNQIKLTVPAKAQKSVGYYQADITWTLTNTPE